MKSDELCSGPVTRSKAALLLSIGKLFDESPNCYFWTITFVRVMPDSYYGNIWSMFLQKMRHAERAGRLPVGWGGVRVVEPFDHGLHYHFITNRRLWVGELRRLARGLGIGRIHVRKAVRSDALYLGKYLGKDWSVHGVRKWGCVGAFEGVKVINTEVRSKTTEATKWLVKHVTNENKSNHANYRQASQLLRRYPDLVKACHRGGPRAWSAVAEFINGRDGLGFGCGERAPGCGVQGRSNLVKRDPANEREPSGDVSTFWNDDDPRFNAGRTANNFPGAMVGAGAGKV